MGAKHIKQKHKRSCCLQLAEIKTDAILEPETDLMLVSIRRNKKYLPLG